MLQPILVGLLTGLGMKYVRPPKVTKNKISLPIGEIIVQEGGVTCRLKKPFSKLSRYYPWRYVPLVMDGFITATLGDGDLDTPAYDYLSEKQKRQLEAALGRFDWVEDGGTEFLEHSSKLVDSAKELKEWMPYLAKKSPSSVAKKLKRLK